MKIYLTIVDYDGDLEKKKNHFYFVVKDVGVIHPGFLEEDFDFYFNGKTEKYFKTNYNIYVKRFKYSLKDFAEHINQSVRNVEIMKDVLEIE